MLKIVKISKQIAALFIGAALLFSCENDIKRVNLITSQYDLPDISIENVKTSYTVNAKIKAKLHAPLVEHFSKTQHPYLELAKGMYLQFYDTNQEIESILTANYAKHYEKEELWVARYNVMLINRKGDTLRTEKLYGDEKRRKVYTDKYVKITFADGTRLSGKNGFESNLSFTEYTFKNVNGMVNVVEDF